MRKADWMGWRGRLPRFAFSAVTKLAPIACVDVLPYRTNNDTIELGLIQRRDADGQIAWNLIGGGIHRREPVADAAARHIRGTLGPTASWQDPDYSRPDAVGEYFPVRRAGFGFDPRKHAIALTFAVQVSGHITPRGEALGFRWFAEDAVPLDEMGFDQGDLVRRMLPIRSNIST